MASSLQFFKHPFELIASLWDSPPPISTPVALPSVGHPLPLAQAAPATEQAFSPHGLCGWIGAEAGAGASKSFVCQAFGQSMPAVVFFVSCAVIAITLLFLVRYLLRAQTALSTLRALDRELERFPSGPASGFASRQMGEKLLLALEGGSRRLPPLGSFGERLRLAIEPAEASPDSILLSRPVSELSGGRRGLDAWLGKPLADELPGWLTAVGLLTTFIAILLGLQSVKVMSDLEVRGIAGLVNGLSGKFCSSIVAIGCAVAVSIADHFVNARVDEDWSSILQRMERLLPHLSVERMLRELLRDRKPLG